MDQPLTSRQLRRRRAAAGLIDRITRQSVAGNCKARHPFALENFEAHPNSAREDNIGRDSISDDQSQNGWQPAVGKSEDKHDQPDNKDAQPEHQQTVE